MPKILVPGTTTKDFSKIQSLIETNINTSVSENQKNAGIVAKIQVRHPAVSFTATIFQNQGRKFVQVPAQQGSNGKTWFPVISLTNEVKDYLIHLYENDKEDRSAWYLELENTAITKKITGDNNNPDLDILDIIIDNNLTYKQQAKNMICKVNIVTSIGTLHNYTIWDSKFGRSLYGMAPTDGKTDRDNGRGIMGYRLAREATAQVLNYLHKMVDFDAEIEIPEGALDPEPAIEEKKAEAEGFQKIGNEAFVVSAE